MADIAITFHSGRISIGRLFTSQPSTRWRDWWRNGENTHGIPREARTAWERRHSVKITLSHVSTSVDDINRGIFVSLNDFPSNMISRNFSIFTHFISHFFISKSMSFSHDIFASISSISCEDFPRAKSVATIAPILVPETALGLLPTSSSLRMIPICASHLAPTTSECERKKRYIHI